MKFSSIKTKYFITGLILCLVSLIPISFFSYLVAHHITVDLTDKMIKEKVLRTSNEIDYWFKSRQNVIDSLAQDIESYGDFSDEQLYKLLKNKINIYEDDTVDFYIGFSNPDKQLISATGWNIPKDYNPTQRPWYQQARLTNNVIFTDPYVDAMTGKLVISVAKALRNNGEIIGVLGSDIYLSEVMKEVDSSKINNNSYGMLLDQQGRIIAHPNRKFLPTSKGVRKIDLIDWKDYQCLIKKLIRNGTQKSIEVRGYDGTDEIFHFSKIASNNWYVGISVDQSEYQAPLQRLFLGFASSIFVSILFAFFITVKLINSMIKPIKSLNMAVRSFSFNTSIRADISSKDEIGELGRNFNEMADMIQEYGHSLEEKVEERTMELQKKNDTIMESIEYASRLQNAIIPDISNKMMLPQSNYFSIWKPRDIVGGDMFWCRGNDQYGLLVLADCTGHGVPGALMSMALNSILDTTIKEMQYHDPSRIMYSIHEELKQVLGQNEKNCEINDGADIGILYIDKMNKKLLFSGAKQHIVVVSEGNIHLMKGSKDSVGYAWEKEPKFKNIEIPYVEGTICYLTTDGFLDQNREMNTGGMGRRGFISFLSKIYQLPMQEQCKIIEADIEEKLSHVSQRDDITVIGLKL